jgi:hypothetical protein
VKQSFRDAQVGGGTDGQEFSQTFDDAQQKREQVVVQFSSKRPATVLQKMAASKLERLVLSARMLRESIEESRSFASLSMTAQI